MSDKNISSHYDVRVTKIYQMQNNSILPRPLLASNISAGFPSPAQDYIEENLDLNQHLITHPSATYFVKVEGYSMINANIYPEDILIVDRAEEPIHKKIVIAVIDGELTIKRLFVEKGKWFLAPENSDFSSIEITKDMNFRIWGVVTYAIHKMR